MSLEEFEKKLNELEDLHNELKAQIAELHERGEEKPKPPHPRPYPVDDQIMYYVNSMGELDETTWISDRFDLGARKIGNVFMTSDAAKFAAERLKVLAEMREWAGNWDDEFTLRYEKSGRVNTFFITSTYRSYGEMRFATWEDAEGCIKAVGEYRIKKYYFMIPEEEKTDDQR